jgi:DNA-binding CsgD family transcriptional regulator
LDALATLLVSADGSVTALAGSVGSLWPRGAEQLVGRRCYECLTIVDGLGRNLCTPHCPLLEACRHRKPAVLHEVVWANGRAALLTAVAGRGADGAFHVLHGFDFPSELASLTEAEVRVLYHLSRGAGTEEIAARLAIRQSTVRTHVRRVLEKLGTSSRVAAVARLRTPSEARPDERQDVL